MRLCFGELSETERAARELICKRGRQAWALVASGQLDAARTSFALLDERIALYVEPAELGGVPCAELSALESSAWPLAELLMAQSPDDSSYVLSLGRAPRALDIALEAVRRTHGLDLARASLRAGFSRGHLLELTLGVPGGTGAEIEQIAAENLVLALLGERLFETWVGQVHVAAAPRGGLLRVLDVSTPRRELQLRELYETVAAGALGVLRGLPEQSWLEQSGAPPSATAAHADWTLLEVEPLGDAQGVRKDDLILASTCTPELLRCYLDGSPCSSRRFSRHGERFVFLSYQDDQATPEERVARRSELEHSLAECLSGVGVVTGVGLGVHTSYVDFALRDLETGLERLVSKLKDLGMPRRSFIQFFDSELSEEWLSISQDSRLT